MMMSNRASLTECLSQSVTHRASECLSQSVTHRVSLTERQSVSHALNQPKTRRKNGEFLQRTDVTQAPGLQCAGRGGGGEDQLFFESPKCQKALLSSPLFSSLLISSLLFSSPLFSSLVLEVLLEDVLPYGAGGGVGVCAQSRVLQALLQVVGCNAQRNNTVRTKKDRHDGETPSGRRKTVRMKNEETPSGRRNTVRTKDEETPSGRRNTVRMEKHRQDKG